MVRALQTRFPTRRARQDEGFTLIEAVVALVVAGIIFSALASVLISGLQASLYGRQNQQATDFMTQQLENLRRLDYGALSHASTDISSDTRLTTCGPHKCLSVDGVNEPVITGTGTVGIPQHRRVIEDSTTNNTRYTIESYITEVPGQDPAQLRRATVHISWDHRGSTRTRSISSLIAYTQRGLPIPVFKFEAQQTTVEANPGAQVTFLLRLTNQGAPDRWNLSLADTGASLGWALALDTNDDGIYEAGTDALLTDTTLDGVIDTGRVGPSETVEFFLTRTSGVSEPVGSVPTTVTATSFGQPTATGAAVALTLTTKLTTSPIAPPPPPPTPVPTPSTPPPADCSWVGGAPAATKPNNSFSVVEYPLHNDPAGDTNHQTQLYMSTASADEMLLPRYSQDIAPTATGRLLEPLGISGATNVQVVGSTQPRRYADWAMQAPVKTSFGGTAVLRIWVARADATSDTASLRAVAYTASSSGGALNRTAVASGTVSLGNLTCAGFQEAYVTLSLPNNTSVDKNGWFGVRVVSTGTTGSLRLAYDVASVGYRPYPASLTVAKK